MDDVILMGDPRVAAIPVRECGDDLVGLHAIPELVLMTVEHNPQHSQTYSFLRQMVVARLQQAQDRLPDGYRLLLSEGYRPYDLQDFYFTRYSRRLLDADPNLSNEEVHLAASRFVSPPEIAPHVSGAAIDLTLATSDGQEVDMGSPMDASPEDSDGACYFAAANISPAARCNRTILATALTLVGMVNYPTEWWHWSYGDRYWALATNTEHAIFGPARTPVLEEPVWRKP
jgi:D-alanyl-D-alanine dipeptidase